MTPIFVPHTLSSTLKADHSKNNSSVSKPLYTKEQRIRRDASIWTPVQGILAPLQLVVCLVSLFLVLRYLNTGEGAHIAGVSVVAKTTVLYIIMITGCLWEREVFGRYLFAPAFFWEDLVSMLVMGLHTLYVLLYFFGTENVDLYMQVALIAYLAYFVNAAQFVYKFRLARLSRVVV